MRCTAYRLQDYSTAQALYKSCLQQSPANVLILSNLAAVHIELKEFPQALKYAQDGLAIDASHVKCLYRCGVAHTNLEQYNDAIVCFKKARQKVSKSDATLLCICRLLPFVVLTDLTICDGAIYLHDGSSKHRYISAMHIKPHFAFVEHLNRVYNAESQRPLNQKKPN